MNIARTDGGKYGRGEAVENCNLFGNEDEYNQLFKIADQFGYKDNRVGIPADTRTYFNILSRAERSDNYRSIPEYVPVDSRNEAIHRRTVAGPGNVPSEGLISRDSSAVYHPNVRDVPVVLGDRSIDHHHRYMRDITNDLVTSREMSGKHVEPVASRERCRLQELQASRNRSRPMEPDASRDRSEPVDLETSRDRSRPVEPEASRDRRSAEYHHHPVGSNTGLLKEQLWLCPYYLNIKYFYYTTCY